MATRKGETKAWGAWVTRGDGWQHWAWARGASLADGSPFIFTERQKDIMDDVKIWRTNISVRSCVAKRVTLPGPDDE